MPQSIEFLADAFDTQSLQALNFIQLLETNRVAFTGQPSSLNTTALELSYELAYLRIFGFWESFLEQSFVRLLCGYERGGGNQEVLLTGQSYSATITQATTRMLAGNRYVAWYVPSDIVGRCRRYFVGANLEFVVASANQILSDQSATRHQIAHVQSHARTQFDAVTMRLTGKRFRASRPGRFLRTIHTQPNRRWLDHFAGQLRGLANQIAR
jgi:hypothetical protein